MAEEFQLGFEYHLQLLHYVLCFSCGASRRTTRYSQTHLRVAAPKKKRPSDENQNRRKNNWIQQRYINCQSWFLCTEQLSNRKKTRITKSSRVHRASYQLEIKDKLKPEGSSIVPCTRKVWLLCRPEWLSTTEDTSTSSSLSPPSSSALLLLLSFEVVVELRALKRNIASRRHSASEEASGAA